MNDVGIHDCAEVAASMVELKEVLLGILGTHDFVKRDELLAQNGIDLIWSFENTLLHNVCLHGSFCLKL